MKTNPNDPIAAKFLKIQGLEQSSGGLTKREYFAAMAIQRMVDATMNKGYCEHTAKMAIMYADALIEALNKEK